MGREITITRRIAAEPTGTLSRVMAATLGKLFEGPTRKAMEADFDDIAKALEGA